MLPAGMQTSSPSITGTPEPQMQQKLRQIPGEDSYRVIVSSPRIQPKARALPCANVPNGAPWILRHIEQWQWLITATGPSSRRATRPHRQPPLIMTRRATGRSMRFSSAVDCDQHVGAGRWPDVHRRRSATSKHLATIAEREVRMRYGPTCANSDHKSTARSRSRRCCSSALSPTGGEAANSAMAPTRSLVASFRFSAAFVWFSHREARERCSYT